MKHIAILIFFTVFFGIFFLGTWYVYSRGSLALSATPYHTLFKWIFWSLSLSFVVGQFLERGSPTFVGHIITYVGSFWLATLWYLFLFVLTIDIVRIFNHFLHFIPANWLSSFLTGPNIFIGVSSIVLLLITAGHINAISPRIIKVNVPINKQGNGQKNITVAFATDIHMGYIIGNKRVAKLVNMINEQKPDLVLFGGDLVDHNPLPVIKENMGVHFKDIKAPFGMFAITGNHEYIGKPDISIEYLSQFGIQYIRDSIVNVNDMLLLVGRDDREKKRFEGTSRTGLNHLMNGIDKSKPIILLDHQPFEFDLAAKEGVDLMMSGHTHKGQLWPFGILTKRIFDLDWGFMKNGNTHYYVSSGFGTWGPPVRIGSRPEIVIFSLELD